ncbi:MAG: UbiD family decarboxylase domain-containing protein, partial [Planctomycetota bacterium]
QEGGFQQVASRIASLLQAAPPASLWDLLGRAREFLPLLRVPPRAVRRGICQEVVHLASRGEVDLRRLPLIKCWPLDGDPLAVGFGLTAEQAGTREGEGRYITFAGVHTIRAEDQGLERPPSHNIGMYRLQLVGPRHLVMHWHMHHDGAAHWRSFKARGERMPVAICFGGEPVLPYAATAPLPPRVSELLMAGFLNGRGIPLVPAKTVPIRVPANSELVIEGYVSHECGMPGYDPRVCSDGIGPGAVFEGPFGDHTGFYSLPDRYPLVEVTAVTRRKQAIFPATVVGLPPQEDYYLGKATERIFLPPLRLMTPDIEDYHLPMFGCFHNFVFVRIRKEYPLQGRRVMMSLWGAGQMAWTKYIVVVDGDVDVHDQDQVLKAVFERCHFGRDLERINGPLDILDHAAPRLGAGSKLGFDATRKVPGEELSGIPLTPGPEYRVLTEDDRGFISDQLLGKAGIASVSVPEVAGGRLLVVGVEGRGVSPGREALQAVLKRPRRAASEMVIAVGMRVNTDDLDDVLFHLCANTDPGRDLLRDGGGIGFDATAKLSSGGDGAQPVRDFPPILEMSEEIRGLVDRRWDEYGF